MVSFTSTVTTYLRHFFVVKFYLFFIIYFFMCFLEVEEEKRETHVHILNIAVAINLFVAMIKTIILLPSIIILCTCLRVLEC